MENISHFVVLKDDDDTTSRSSLEASIFEDMELIDLFDL